MKVFKQGQHHLLFLCLCWAPVGLAEPTHTSTLRFTTEMSLIPPEELWGAARAEEAFPIKSPPHHGKSSSNFWKTNQRQRCQAHAQIKKMDVVLLLHVAERTNPRRSGTRDAHLDGFRVCSRHLGTFFPPLPFSEATSLMSPRQYLFRGKRYHCVFCALIGPSVIKLN